jgi:hypothetical protein
MNIQLIYYQVLFIYFIFLEAKDAILTNLLT